MVNAWRLGLQKGLRVEDLLQRDQAAVNGLLGTGRKEAGHPEGVEGPPILCQHHAPDMNAQNDLAGLGKCNHTYLP